MTTTESDLKVYCYRGDDSSDPHALILTLDNDDHDAFYAQVEREGRMSRHSYGKKLIVTNQGDGRRYVLRSAPCGAGCRCGAAALPLIDAGRWFVGDDCKLNGKPATIIGRQLDYGIVACYPEGERVEFAWETIARIMGQGGEFKS